MAFSKFSFALALANVAARTAPKERRNLLSTPPARDVQDNWFLVSTEEPCQTVSKVSCIGKFDGRNLEFDKDLEICQVHLMKGRGDTPIGNLKVCTKDNWFLVSTEEPQTCQTVPKVCCKEKFGGRNLEFDEETKMCQVDVVARGDTVPIGDYSKVCSIGDNLNVCTKDNWFLVSTEEPCQTVSKVSCNGKFDGRNLEFDEDLEICQVFVEGRGDTPIDYLKVCTKAAQNFMEQFVFTPPTRDVQESSLLLTPPTREDQEYVDTEAAQKLWNNLFFNPAGDVQAEIHDFTPGKFGAASWNITLSADFELPEGVVYDDFEDASIVVYRTEADKGRRLEVLPMTEITKLVYVSNVTVDDRERLVFSKEGMKYNVGDQFSISHMEVGGEEIPFVGKKTVNIVPSCTIPKHVGNMDLTFCCIGNSAVCNVACKNDYVGKPVAMCENNGDQFIINGSCTKKKQRYRREIAIGAAGLLAVGGVITGIAGIALSSSGSPDDEEEMPATDDDEEEMPATDDDEEEMPATDDDEEEMPATDDDEEEMPATDGSFCEEKFDRIGENVENKNMCPEKHGVRLNTTCKGETCNIATCCEGESLSAIAVLPVALIPLFLALILTFLFVHHRRRRSKPVSGGISASSTNLSCSDSQSTTSNERCPSGLAMHETECTKPNGCCSDMQRQCDRTAVNVDREIDDDIESIWSSTAPVQIMRYESYGTDKGDEPRFTIERSNSVEEYIERTDATRTPTFSKSMSNLQPIAESVPR